MGSLTSPAMTWSLKLFINNVAEAANKTTTNAIIMPVLMLIDNAY